MKAKMWLMALIAGLMGFLSPVGADAQQNQAGGSEGSPSSLFITFNNVWAPYGTTVSALWRSYHSRGGKDSLDEFLTGYCTLQGMKGCGDADFRKLPVGYWKVPAAPIAYYLKNGKKAPETFTFTLVKKSEGVYAPAISEVRSTVMPTRALPGVKASAALSATSTQPITSASTESAPKSVAAQPAVEPSVVKPAENTTAVTQLKTTAVVKMPHEVKRHNPLLVPIQTGDPTTAPSSVARDDSLIPVIATAAFVAGLMLLLP